MARDTQSKTMASPSAAVRFFSLLEQPQPQPDPNKHDNHHNSLELDESDVVWSSSSAYSTDTDSHSPPRPSNSPTTQLRRPRTHLTPPNYGLSAALAPEHLPPLVRQKSTLNPSLSSASAARMVLPVIRSENSHLNSNGAARRFHQSAPVNVPVWPKKKVGEFGNLEQLDEVDDEREDEEEMVPPHLIVARSHVTFSVFEGVGRTLKGRDLRSVRNAVFQKTGFID